MSAEVATQPTVEASDTTSKPGEDPFAAQRTEGDAPFGGQKLDGVAGSDDMAVPVGDSVAPTQEKATRRTSREWDASKVPPSQFQKRKGSVYATPSSRDGHAHDKTRDQAYHDALKKEKKGWTSIFKKSDKTEEKK
jgi:hypothetical protein